MSNESSPSSGGESIAKTFVVALGVSLVCAIFVAFSAVTLKEAQLFNKELDRQTNILKAAGLVDAADSPSKETVAELFSRIETKYVDLETGDYVEQPASPYDMKRASKDPAFSEALSTEDDLAKIRRRVNVAEVYIAKSEEGEISSVILPVSGYGLWSTLYGFLALSADGAEVVGLGFYEHAETPGLGGEVDNPKWKALWPGKRVFDENGDIGLTVVKGAVDPNSAKKDYQIDGLAGATLTTRGVDNLIAFWLGENGFGPFLKNVKGGGV